MSNFLLRFVTAGILLAVIDSVWLVLVANKFYKNQIGHLLRKKPHIFAAVLFYMIFLVGLVVFVLNPALGVHEWKWALGLGALLGFVAYATYDLTNLATLKDFSTKLVFVDLIWGTVLTASVASLAYVILTQWFAQ